MMAAKALAIRPCPQCGYTEPSNNDPPPAVLFRPWHVRDRKAVHAYVQTLGEEAREWLLALFVDRALNLLAVETIGRGDISGVRVNFAAILCRGHALDAAGFILVHNHPSGDPSPSASDIALTNKLRRLAAELDIPLLDHCIVAGDMFANIGGL